MIASEDRSWAARYLIETWRRWGMPPRPPVPPEVLAEFEAENHLYLPPDFREYLRRCNGFDYDDWHDSPDEVGDTRGLMEFFPVEKMESLPASEVAGTESGADAPFDYLIFADYLIASHDYVIRLSPDPAAPTPVSAWFGPNYPLYQVAESFTGFVRVYVDEPDSLIPRS